MSVQVRVITPADLSADLESRWRELQQANPSLRSPYFCPEFTVLTAESGRDVRIAVIEEGATIAAFLPFERLLGRRGGPVGGPVSDYHGVISTPEFACDAIDLVRGCGLATWRFDHLPATQLTFENHVVRCDASPIIDLSDGVEAYEAERRASGSKLIRQLGTLERKLTREVGPVRVERCVRDRSLMDALLGWKSTQYRASGLEDLFAHRWAVDLVRRIDARRGPTFAGVLSGLWAGDRLIAAHFGMRSSSVLHYWFPAYDAGFRPYSPGLLLLLALIRGAPDDGVRFIDMGKGDSLYKRRLMNGEVKIAEGAVTRSRLRRGIDRACSRAESWARRTPLAGPARGPTRLLGRFQRWARYR